MQRWNFRIFRETLAFKLKFCVLLCSLALCISCDSELPAEPLEKNDSQIISKESIESATLNEKLIYTEHHLTTLMEEVIKVNPTFGKISEFTKVGRNSRPGVYLEELLKNSYKKNALTYKEEEHPSIGAFENVEGETWYPIVEQINEGDGDSKNAIFLLKSFDTELEREVVRAFNFDNSGELKLFYEDFTEEQFLNLTTAGKLNPSVFAISLAQCEPAAEHQQLAYKSSNCGGTSSSGGSVGSTATGSVPLEIQKLKIMDKKETWLEKAEVYIYGYAMSDNINFYWPLGYLWGDRATKDGAKIRNNPEYKLGKFSNNDVGKGRFKTINKHMMHELESSSTFISYIIYEYDGFPALLKKVPFKRPGGTTAYISYRSYNKKYIAAQVTSANNFEPSPDHSVLRGYGNTVKNDVIEYNFNPAQ